MFHSLKLYDKRLSQSVGGFSLPRLEREEGQTMAEYAMILALIAIAVVVAIGLLSGQISTFFSTVGSNI